MHVPRLRGVRCTYLEYVTKTCNVHKGDAPSHEYRAKSQVYLQVVEQ